MAACNHSLVHADVGILASIVGQHDAHRVLPLLALDEDCVAPVKLELLHLRSRERYHRVVVVGGWWKGFMTRVRDMVNY